MRVHGSFGDAGVLNGTPEFRSSITSAAYVISYLEQWILYYAQRNTPGVIQPHGWISGVRSDDPDRPSYPSAVTEIFFDVRINPLTTPGHVKAQFAQFSPICKNAARHWYWTGKCMAPSLVAQPIPTIEFCSATRGWERIEGKTHPVPDYMACQTDGSALRRFGCLRHVLIGPGQQPAHHFPLETAWAARRPRSCRISCPALTKFCTQ